MTRAKFSNPFEDYKLGARHKRPGVQDKYEPTDEMYAERARANAVPQELTAFLMGDPKSGRSALDKGLRHEIAASKPPNIIIDPLAYDEYG